MPAPATTSSPAPARRPRVAIVANVMPPYRLHAHRRIARELHEAEVFTLLTHGEGDQPWAQRGGADINAVEFGPADALLSTPKVSRREWAKGGRLCRWLDEHRADAVLLCGYDDAARLRVLLWCKARGVPVFLWTDGNIASDHARGLKLLAKHAYLQPVLRAFDVLMPSGTLGARLLQRYGGDPAKMIFWPLEPDYAAIRAVTSDPGGADAAAMRARFGLREGRRRVLCCSRLVTHKKVDHAVRALGALARERPEWDLLVVGDGPERAALEALARELLPGRATFTGFVGDPAHIAALYACADVLCLPSVHEPWALVVNEAACAGLALVCSDVVGAAAELVREGVNGRVFRAGDEAALTHALRDVTDPARIDALKSASPRVLDEWVQRGGDPVRGLRTALRRVGLLPAEARA